MMWRVLTGGIPRRGRDVPPPFVFPAQSLEHGAQIDAIHTQGVDCDDGDLELARALLCARREELSHHLQMTWWLATPPGSNRPAGTLGHFQTGQGMSIQWVRTVVGQQRRGLARALMQAALEEGKSRGQRWCSLVVSEQSQAARRLYQSLGFQDIGRWHIYTRGR